MHGRILAAITTVALLEAYNALVHDYSVDSGEASYKIDGLTRSRKIKFVLTTIKSIRRAIEIAQDHNARSFDANLIASAEIEEITVIVSNDHHIERLCRERKLILENPIPLDVRKKMEI